MGCQKEIAAKIRARGADYLLVLKANHGRAFEAVREHFERTMQGQAGEFVRAVLQYAADLGKTPAQVAIAWVLSHPEVTCAISGADTTEQLDDVLGGGLPQGHMYLIEGDAGAGKTTRIPPALVALGPTILLQPRRVAARALARHGLPLWDCGCGRAGCYENYVSGPGLARIAAWAGIAQTNPAALAGDPAGAQAAAALVARAAVMGFLPTDADTRVLDTALVERVLGGLAEHGVSARSLLVTGERTARPRKSASNRARRCANSRSRSCGSLRRCNGGYQPSPRPATTPWSGSTRPASRVPCHCCPVERSPSGGT